MEETRDHIPDTHSAKRENVPITIRELSSSDISHGFLESLDNLIHGTSELTPKAASETLKAIKSNKYHMVFVASIRQDGKDIVVGTTTLLMEPKFIFGGSLVGHVEDVSVRKGFEKMGIGARLVNHVGEVAERKGCVKLVLDCSTATMPFYQKLGYEYQDNCMKKSLSSRVVP